MEDRLRVFDFERLEVLWELLLDFRLIYGRKFGFRDDNLVLLELPLLREFAGLCPGLQLLALWNRRFDCLSLFKLFGQRILLLFRILLCVSKDTLDGGFYPAKVCVFILI